MFTFQSIMFVSLGFLCALLLGFIVAPAFWARAVRLTTDRLRASLPLSEQEISAERDRLRAENAIRVHQLTAKIEQSRLYDARQKVEINRRDGTISALQRTLQQIETEREGSENARRVLEATITQRVPEIEARLMEARQLLAKRDAEMTALQSDTGRTFRALDDAMQVNAQQRAEIDRLKSSLAGGLGTRLQNTTTGSDSEETLKAELDSLRTSSREQSALIAKLQGSERDDVTADDIIQVDGKGSTMREGKKASVIPLTPAAANGVKGWEAPIKDGEGDAASAAETSALKARLEAQDAKIESLSAQLATYEEGATSKGRSLSLRDTKSALKARIAASVKEIAARDDIIEGLRRQIATANERTARQASYYQDELRRLGAGGSQASPSKRPAADTSEPGETPSSKASGKARETKVGTDGHANHETVDAVDPVVADVSTNSTLEERLAAVKADSSEPDSDFDQHTETADPDPKPQRGKLMDRIAGLAKR